MNTSNNSIKAIIFTIILFLFIIFISLFKGIYLYNIKFKNIYIKKIFIKINHKIVLKINNITIKNDKNYTKQAINLNKTILLITKILNAFEEIKVNNLKYSNNDIKHILLKNNFLYINSNFLVLKAKLNPSLKNTFINFQYINIPTYKISLKKTILNINFKNYVINLFGSTQLKKYKINFKFILKSNNYINGKISSKKISYKTIILSNLLLNLNFNLNNLTYKIYGNTKKILAKYKKIDINSTNTYFFIDQKHLKFTAKTLNLSNLPYISYLSINNLKGTYNIKDQFLITDSKNINTTYQNFKIKFQNSSLLFKNIKNLTFISTQCNITDQNNKTKLEHIILNILNKYKSLSINNSQFKNNKINLKSSKILSNLTNIFIKIITGKVYGFPTQLNNIKINIKKHSANIDSIIYNNIKANNIKFKNNILTFHSNALFNKNIKDILYKFLNIKIPIMQVKGKNNINGYIDFTKLNKINSFTDIITKNTLLKLYDLNISVPQAEINITNNNLKFQTNNASMPLSKIINLSFKGNGIIDFNKSLLLMNGYINFYIPNLILLNNYKEQAYIDFNKSTLKTKNSNLFIDFKNKDIIINYLKNILKYTIFKNFVKNGILLINYNNNINATVYFLLKLPILYEHNNLPINKLSKKIDKVFLHIKLKQDKYIIIYNKYLTFYLNKNNIFANVKNIDIDLFPLEKLLNHTNNIKDFNYTINLNTKNANLIYKTHKILSQQATLTYKENNFYLTSKYKNSYIKGHTNQGYLLLEGKNFSIEEFKALLPKFDLFNKINLDFVMVKSPEDFYIGKIYIKNALTKKLKLLNNIIAFINTIPSILTLTYIHPGYSSHGYKIKTGMINYLFYKNIFYIKQAKIEGNNIDFFAKGYIDFNKNYIFLKITSHLKIKIKNIPIIGKGLSYLLFGKDGSIDIKMVVKGNLDNPKVEKDIGKDILLTPFNLFKRAITLPFNLF